MRVRWLTLVFGMLCLGGCLYHVREQTDQKTCELASHALDSTAAPCLPTTAAGETKSDSTGPTGKSTSPALIPPTDTFTTTLLQDDRESPRAEKGKLQVRIPRSVPGAETPPLPHLPEESGPEKDRAVNQLYPNLPPLPAEPQPLPGPDGQPYTLAMLQQIAAENSAPLRQAVSDVKAAEGNLIAARAYPNPVVGVSDSPSSDNSTSGTWGFFVNQTIKTGGKLRLSTAAAEMDLRNSELALRRARSDLATQVRTAYFGLLVAREAMLVNRGMSQFTDRMFELQRGQIKVGVGAPYEPAGLSAQVWTIRLAYKQSMEAYIFAWKQLVAAMGLRQLPLSEVAGSIDHAIPNFDYDEILAHALQNHTDVLTARNAIDKASYNLKLAQVTPGVPDVALGLTVAKDFVVFPQQWSYTLTLGVPLPIWDQGKGQVVSAEAALVRATEEPHRVEMTLTTNLAAAFQSYKSNLEGLEYYRLHILPDLVRYYRGVQGRRQADLSAAFGDLLAAQLNLTTSVTAYLAVLGQMWTSVVTVADFLQTDDLFQFAQPRMLPPLTELDPLCPWPCPHPCGTPGAGPCPCGEGVQHSTTADLYPHFSFEKTNGGQSCSVNGGGCGTAAPSAPSGQKDQGPFVLPYVDSGGPALPWDPVPARIKGP